MTLDFSTINEFKTKAEFKYLFEDMLLQVVGRLGFKRERADADLLVQLGEWMKSRPAASLVMLVDEYDAPLTQSLTNPPLFDEVRDALSRFYSVVKSAEGCLRFFFMTGIMPAFFRRSIRLLIFRSGRSTGVWRDIRKRKLSSTSAGSWIGPARYEVKTTRGRRSSRNFVGCTTAFVSTSLRVLMCTCRGQYCSFWRIRVWVFLTIGTTEPGVRSSS